MQSLQRMSANRSAPGLTRRLQVWWALRSQKRRRESQNQVPVVPPVPVITGATVIWDGSEPGYADVSISWRIDYGASPVGSIEVFVHPDGESAQSLGTVPGSDLVFYHPRASTVSEVLYYQVRYVYDDFGGTVVGALSAEYAVQINV